MIQIKAPTLTGVVGILGSPTLVQSFIQKAPDQERGIGSLLQIVGTASQECRYGLTASETLGCSLDGSLPHSWFLGSMTAHPWERQGWRGRAPGLVGEYAGLAGEYTGLVGE